MNKQARQRLLFLGRLALGVSLLTALLIWNDNGRKVLNAFVQAQPLYLIPFFCITYPLLGASCMKWGLFLTERGVVIPFHRLLSLYLIGSFFNNFLPSMIGGDLVRAYVLGRQIDSHAHSLASIFLERITGMIALVTLAVTFYLCDPQLREEPVISVSIVIIGSGCIGLLTVLWKPQLASWLLRPVAAHPYIKQILPKLVQFHEYVMYFKDKPLLVGKAMAYSFAFHFLTGVNVYIACLVLNIPFSFLSAIALTPIILLVSSVPLSINGLGVWEWAFSVYMAQAGAQIDEGLAVALLIRAKVMLVSVVGGVLFLAERAPIKSQASGRAGDI